jgi:hypothetical protein
MTMASRRSLQLTDPPVLIRQNDFSPAQGNALQACVASLFGRSLIEVPNFIAMECGYLKAIEDYLYVDGSYKIEKKSGVVILKRDVGKLCILRGKSPRGDFGHVVVARVKEQLDQFEMIHDPHPDETFLDPKEPAGWYMVFNEINS